MPSSILSRRLSLPTEARPNTILNLSYTQADHFITQLDSILLVLSNDHNQSILLFTCDIFLMSLFVFF